MWSVVARPKTIGETSNIHGGVPNGTPDSYSGPQKATVESSQF